MGDAEQLGACASLEAAEAWLEAAADEEWELAWSRVEPAYRRVLVERQALEEGLDLGDPETSALIEDAAEERSEFGEGQCLEFLDAVAQVPNRAWIIYPAPVALDCELVLMVDAARMIDGEEPSEPADFSIEVVSPVATEAAPRRGFQTTACLFYMRCDDYSDWLIAGFNEEPPDWPTSS